MRVGVILTVLTAVASLAGCNGSEAKFVLGKETESLIREARKPVEKAITEHFGTPHKLVAWEKLPIDYGKVEKAPAAGDAPAASHSDYALLTKTNQYSASHETAGWQLVDGRNLYMRHCLHCHGVSGDGNGPTAPYLNPRPRDYRGGEFKFTSTAVTVKARRDDLHLVLQNGIPGTSMPSFALLKPNELTALVEYVRWLAMRGEFEKRLVAELSGDYSEKAVVGRIKDGEKRPEIVAAFTKLVTPEKDQPAEFAGTIKDVGDNLAADWLAAEDEANLIVPKHPRQLPSADPKSVGRGRALYMSEKLKCYTCHGLAAKGDGTSTVDYWAIPRSSPEKKFEDRGLHDEWGNSIKPRNLTLGQYRGGRRPIDLYRRIYAGIKGTPMAGFATALRDANDENGKALTDDQINERMDRHIWDIVNYILEVPYQKQTIEPRMPMAAAAPAAATTPAPAK